MADPSFLQKRLLIVTGKGGVGKTTLTAAIARHLAAQGKKVICAETVPLAETPSQLTLALGGPKPLEEPVLVAKNLWACLLTPAAGHLRFLRDTLPLRVLADAAMRSQGLRRFLSAAPAFSDMGVMYRMMDLMQRKGPDGALAFDVCIIDSPATGHALALAQIPEFLTRVIPGGPIQRAARQGVEILTDPATTSTIVVTLPETLPVTEALELKRGLEKHRLPVTAIIVNRVPVDPFSSGEHRAVSELMGRGGEVLGARELKRIERAQAALTLLDERANGALHLTLPEVEGTGVEAAQTLSRLVARLGAAPGERAAQVDVPGPQATS